MECSISRYLLYGISGLDSAYRFQGLMLVGLPASYASVRARLGGAAVYVVIVLENHLAATELL
jgi:hypothetical protein